MFRHTTRVNIRFGDIDLLHHVNNAAYCSILDEGRITYFRDMAGELFDWNHIPVVLVNINLNFISPAHLYDKTEVLTRCSRIGTKSFDIEQEIRIRPDGRLLVKANSTLVAFDSKTNQSHPLTPEWIEAIERFEGQNLRVK